MTWQINSYFKALYEDPPPELIMTSVLAEHLGVVVEFTGEDEWSVFLCRPWNTSCLHGLTKEEAFEIADELAGEWRKGIRHLLDKGRLMGTLTHSATDQVEEEVGSKGRIACNKIRDRYFGNPYKPDLHLVTDDDNDDEWLIRNAAMNKPLGLIYDYTALYDTLPF